jgi:hypothetical protein
MEFTARKAITRRFARTVNSRLSMDASRRGEELADLEAVYRDASHRGLRMMKKNHAYVIGKTTVLFAVFLLTSAAQHQARAKYLP